MTLSQIGWELVLLGRFGRTKYLAFLADMRERRIGKHIRKEFLSPKLIKPNGYTSMQMYSFSPQYERRKSLKNLASWRMCGDLKAGDVWQLLTVKMENHSELELCTLGTFKVKQRTFIITSYQIFLVPRNADTPSPRPCFSFPDYHSSCWIYSRNLKIFHYQQECPLSSLEEFCFRV